ncbi:MAG: hypothetical protein KY468_20215, partial [Armatimonadetes bacterium]|nr:hypothetical protein [Armatimonadota bacterium]
MKPWDVLGLGCAAADDLLYVESFPEPDAKTPVLRSERQCGGQTATALVAASRLGARCAFGGVLGHDPLSQYVEETLIREGVDVTPAVRSEDAAPIHATIIVDLHRQTRSILSHRRGRTGADDTLPEADVIRAAKALLIDHHGMSGSLRAAKIAREAGIPVVADFERWNHPLLGEILPCVDHLIVSRSFALGFTGARDESEAASLLARQTQGTVVVTCGGEGGFVIEPGMPGPVPVPAFRVAVADTTGCGDVFHGAYAAELARGAAMPERIRFAAACAAMKAMHPGGQAG